MAFRGTGGAQAPARRVARTASGVAQRAKAASKAASRPVTPAWVSADSNAQHSLPQGYHLRLDQESFEPFPTESFPTGSGVDAEAPTDGLPSRPASGPGRPSSGPPALRPHSGPPGARPNSGQSDFRRIPLKGNPAALSQPPTQLSDHFPAPPPLDRRPDTGESMPPIPLSRGGTPLIRGGTPLRPKSGGPDFRSIPLRGTADGAAGELQPPEQPTTGSRPAPPPLPQGEEDIRPISALSHSAGHTRPFPVVAVRPKSGEARLMGTATKDFKEMSLNTKLGQGSVSAAGPPADAFQPPPPPPLPPLLP
eukprot:gnl/MRDRNA2_/MRDRNA2_84459_c0_seq1.p1 gnl/MRDRNA2_/MRDRNA2_84459_c0~~gnl/MRDRNA2_/MRDRNA2_84459_c0_seq1.p1  ORF type:complete len:319 (-),score=49.92 gnl/MRDRNA2_/MRDRNA2_84459_c0_seq1:546-1469(-)